MTYFAAAQVSCSMSNEKADDLARKCTDLARKGNSFPTVWSRVLKGHSLIDGIPRERLEGKKSLLFIPLITGDWLVFDADAKEFRVD
jgi:hypothetical protein